MKQQWEAPAADINYFQCEDVITVSPPFFGGGETADE